MKLFYGILRWLAAVATAVWASSALAAQLILPVPVVTIIVFYEVLLLLNLPYNLKESYSALWLHSRGYGSMAGQGLGFTFIVAVITVALPIAILVWLLAELYLEGGLQLTWPF